MKEKENWLIDLQNKPPGWLVFKAGTMQGIRLYSVNKDIAEWLKRYDREAYLRVDL
jgi:hypothetical protein